MTPALSSSSDCDRRRRCPGGQNRVGELTLPGHSEHHSLILLVLNEDNDLVNTESEYSPMVMALSLLVTAVGTCSLLQGDPTGGVVT
jgi:hypothetical protein